MLLELQASRQYFEIMKYTFYTGWLRKSSTDEVIKHLDELVEKRIGNSSH
jgi:hypothetical protein